MSVRFILGRPGTGKTLSCMEEVRAELMEHPDGPPLIYIVPDHMTFDMEYAFARTPELGGMIRLNVFSFQRLAMRVLQQSGGITRYHLNRTGVTMLLRRIVEQEKREFRIFKKSSDQIGFYDLLSATLTEFKRYCLSPEDVSDQAESLDGETADRLILRDKLHDLSLVYKPFAEALAGKYVENEDYLRLMAEKIAETDFIKNAQIWIDGFQTMTPEEQLVTEELMEHARRVTIALGIDRNYDRPPDEFSVFRHPALLFLNLKERAEDLNLTVESIVVRGENRRHESSALKHLADNFGRYPYKQSETTEGIFLTEAVNRREEVEQAARDVLTLVRDHGYRYRDITVLVRHLDEYQDLVETLFADYDLPVFIDRKRPMRHHPLIELIRSALEVVRQNWPYEPVFRCVKTGLLTPQTGGEAMDALENFVLAFGIRGKRWLQEWTCRQDSRSTGGEESTEAESETADAGTRQQEWINRQRRIVAEPLASFEQNIRSAPDVRGKCSAIYRFLKDLHVPRKLDRLALRAAKEGRLAEAKEHKQVWQAVSDMLDQCVEASGDEQLSFDLFSEIIDTGLDSLEFATVPPSLDQVLVGSLDRMRSSRLRAVFLLGVNEGIVPANPHDEGLLSGDDRVTLESRGMHVADHENGQMAEENELIYRALLLPKEKLFLSWPLATESGDALTRSPLIHRIRRLFPRLSVRLSPSNPNGLAESEQITFVAGPHKTLGYLTTQIHNWRKGYPIADFWWDAFDWYVAHDESGRLRRVMAGMFAENQAHLEERTARELYGGIVRASVSRMELYYACPFAQFASYGLQLRERDVFRLAAPDIGVLFHLAMKMLCEYIWAGKNSDVALPAFAEEDVSKKRQAITALADRLAGKIVDTLAPRLQRQILSSSNRYRYLQYKLSRVVAAAARALIWQAVSGGFIPSRFEQPFRSDLVAGPYSGQPADDARIELIGRIDRIDKAVDESGRRLFRIIDYKSGSKALSLTEVYHGLSLQMLTYLDAVMSQEADRTEHLTGMHDQIPALPAGILYFHVHNPMLRLRSMPADEEEVNQLLEKEFRMNGLLLNDAGALHQMDRSVSEGRDSLIVPFGYKKNGELTKYSSVVDSKKLDELRQYTKEKIVMAGEKIVSGDVRIYPYRLQNRAPCTYCPYRPVCRFDQSQPGNDFRLLSKMPDAKVFEKIDEKYKTSKKDIEMRRDGRRAEEKCESSQQPGGDDDGSR